MGARFNIVVASVALLLGAHAVVLTQQNPYRLKEPDQTKLCVECHSDFAATLTKRYVHTAVKTGDCSGCHDPHVSSHGKLLASDTRQICASCHENVVPRDAKSAHQVAANGECSKCHDPHGSDHPANLVAQGDELCASCHKTVSEAVTNARFKHSPVEQGCVKCHDPHGSGESAHLLKTGVPSLCVGCHKPDTPSFISRHMRYPVGQASCTSCHDPHGSNQAALLLDTLHAPVANRACAQCHDAPDSPTPFATKRPGYELCKGCHNDMVTETLAKSRLHWPVADQGGCINCHSPHASKQAKLLSADTATLCGRCHADTVKRSAALAVKHAPVQDGSCVACHSPHGSSGTYLVDKPSIIAVCTTCHDYQQHSAHPIGQETVDPRNKNLRVDCLSCHNGHGTDHKWMLLAATSTELCTQCHQQFAR